MSAAGDDEVGEADETEHFVDGIGEAGFEAKKIGKTEGAFGGWDILVDFAGEPIAEFEEKVAWGRARPVEKTRTIDCGGIAAEALGDFS